jgi:hypothetical protein
LPLNSTTSTWDPFDLAHSPLCKPSVYSHFSNGTERYLISFRLGHGIFSVDGKAWEHSRALLRPQFSRDQVSDLDLEERHLQNMILALPVNSDGWTGQPIYSLLTSA